jgi:hypothetical protein
MGVKDYVQIANEIRVAGGIGFIEKALFFLFSSISFIAFASANMNASGVNYYKCSYAWNPSHYDDTTGYCFTEEKYWRDPATDKLRIQNVMNFVSLCVMLLLPGLIVVALFKLAIFRSHTPMVMTVAVTLFCLVGIANSAIHLSQIDWNYDAALANDGETAEQHARNAEDFKNQKIINVVFMIVSAAIIGTYYYRTRQHTKQGRSESEREALLIERPASDYPMANQQLTEYGAIQELDPADM